MDENMDLQQEQEEQPQEQPERLLAGKYKTAEELERAYEEAQAAMTRAQQEAAELRGRTTTDTPPANPAYDPNAYAEQFNQQFFDNPYQNLSALMQNVQQQTYQTIMQGQAAIRRAQSTFKGDPVYPQVADSFEAELMTLDPSLLANPQVTQKVYDSVVGAHVRAQAQRAQQDPAARTEMLQHLGVAQPDSTPDAPVGRVDSQSASMIEALGVDAKDVNSVINRYQKLLEGGE